MTGVKPFKRENQRLIYIKNEKRETLKNHINKRRTTTEHQIPELGQVQNNAGLNILIGTNLHPYPKQYCNITT